MEQTCENRIFRASETAAVNQIRLCGFAASEPQFSHENHGRQFYRFLLECPRLSGTTDILPILADRELLDALAAEGDAVSVTGQLRSFNSHSETGRHLILSVFASQIRFCSEPPCNEVLLRGTLCKMPVLRRTPLGRDICDAILAVRRQYGRTDYLPCIFWGAAARMIGSRVPGDTVQLDGRMQSREYRKVLPDGTAEWRTAYEISALTVYPE